jgi:hypothetical protein
VKFRSCRRNEKLDEEKGEKSEALWGPAKVEGKKRNTLLSVHL